MPSVAPHAGAWIETNAVGVFVRFVTVAPHAGAWIETHSYGEELLKKVGRAPRGRVD